MQIIAGHLSSADGRKQTVAWKSVVGWLVCWLVDMLVGRLFFFVQRQTVALDSSCTLVAICTGTVALCLYVKRQTIAL